MGRITGTGAGALCGRVLAAALLTFLGSGAAVASDAIAQLRFLMADVHSLTANFQQTVVDAQKKQILHSGGTVALQRPGRFRWDYRTPYPQLIVGDGKRIWIYDTELEQITVKPMAKALGSTPSLLLSGGLNLDKNFTYHALSRNDGLQWVELVPRKPDSSFSKVDLGFAANALAAMDLVDGFGQVTRFRFTDVKVNPTVDPSLFHFVPPAGVDVVGQ